MDARRRAAQGLQCGDEAIVLTRDLLPALDAKPVRTVTEHRVRSVLSEDRIRELRDRFEAMARDYEAAPDKRRAIRPVEIETQAALWLCLCLCLATPCRIGEPLITEWRHLNFETGTWFVPDECVKGSRGKKPITSYASRPSRCNSSARRMRAPTKRAGASQAAMTSCMWT